MGRTAQGLLERLDEDFDAVFLQVCARGYQALGRTHAAHPMVRDNPWQVTPAFPPSYGAQGRYRFLETLRLARRLAQESGPRILEVAAGGAFNAACLWEPGREVWVNDLRAIGDGIDAFTTGPHLRQHVGDLFSLSPEAVGTFDVVVAAEVLEHVAHGDRFAALMRRLVRPGGALLLTTPNGRYVRSRLPTHAQVEDFAALEARQFQPDADGHLYLYTPEELCRVLRAAGFERLEVTLSLTPALTGHVALRALPKRQALAPHYLRLDRGLRALGAGVRQRLCTQLNVVAR